MSTLGDATKLLKRLANENPDLSPREVWNLFAGQAGEKMVTAIMVKFITMMVEVMRQQRLH
jgi:hypothetical protein